MKTIRELAHQLSRPSAALLEDLKKINGDILLLGAGGKMGPSMAELAINGVKSANTGSRIIAVSRFSDNAARERLRNIGVETVSADLLDDKQLADLPDCENVIFMAGTKFGTTGNEPYTWAMNSYVPGRVAEKFRGSRIVVFSTGNVYPLLPVTYGGASETTEPAPIGEYAQSCLGRERIFEYFSRTYGTPITIFRLNYAIETRYGVLLEIAKAVHHQQPIDVSMGSVNVIWQGDANERALRSLTICESPPQILNVTGPESVSVRWAGQQFGQLLGKAPLFTGQEQETALLSNAAKAHKLFGYPTVSLRQMMEWIAEWVLAGGEELNKPTHFQEREGNF